VLKPKSKTVLQVIQAFDHLPIAEIATDDEAALEAKLAAAVRVARDRNSWLKPYERIEVLQRLAALVEDRRDHFSNLIAREGGKPLTDAKIEVARAIDGIRNAAEELRHFAGHQIPMGITPASAGRLAFTTREPIGVVVAISAFNHPLNLIVHQVAPAIAVNCPIIVKPATATPLCCLDFVKLVHQAGLPEPWCQTFVTADNALAERIATDSRVGFLSFIGSARVGWSLRNKLAPGTRCALEHGGVAPAIVHSTANLGELIEPLAKGGYYHAGQVCVSTQRIFVHSDIATDFIDCFTNRVSALRVGDPLSPDTEVGPLIRPYEADRVEAWIEEAVATGASLPIGGERLSETTLRPAILLEPSTTARVSREEVFGPVTCVYRFQHLNDAIDAANALPMAFQASIFTRDIDSALHAAERIDAATVMINDHTAFRTDWMPFAGRRQSGYGIGGIPWTMHEMTQHKMLVLRHAAT
jgi:acyl-CoA reductase-like NAD-dependent aldehyde dehydrogenase